MILVNRHNFFFTVTIQPIELTGNINPLKLGLNLFYQNQHNRVSFHIQILCILCIQ